MEISILSKMDVHGKYSLLHFPSKKKAKELLHFQVPTNKQQRWKETKRGRTNRKDIYIARERERERDEIFYADTGLSRLLL